MPVFAYRALTATGHAKGGVVDAETRRAAWQELRGRGVYPTDLQEQPSAAGPRRRRVRPEELAATMRELATLVGAGLPLADALETAAEQASHADVAQAFTVARARIREGASLADALVPSTHALPSLAGDLIRAGEESGALAAVLERLAEHTEASAASRRRLRAALAYPAAMLAATALVLLFLVLWVIPQVADLFTAAGRPLPLATRLLLGIVHVVQQTWWVALPLALGGLWGLRTWTASEPGRLRIDTLVVRMPGIGHLVRTSAMARLARTLATLLAGGVPLEAALAVAGPVTGNRRLAGHVARARERVRQGEALAAALGQSGTFPPILVRLVAAGEQSDGLVDALDRAAATHEREFEARVATITALVEPLLILLVGAVALLLAAAVLLPLLDLGALA